MSAAGSLATAAGLFFLFFQWRSTGKQLSLTQEQVNYTQQELESTLRAWFGITHVKNNLPTKPNLLEVHIKNHGRIPGRMVKVQLVFAKNIAQADARNENPLPQNITIFPDRETHIDLKDESSTKGPYVGILITYQYLTNKQGEFALKAQDVKKTELEYLEVIAK
jgi:hypothetical protein